MAYPEPHNLNDIYGPGAENADDGIDELDPDGCEVEYEDEDEIPDDEINIRNFVSGNMDEDDLARRLVEDGVLEL